MGYAHSLIALGGFLGLLERRSGRPSMPTMAFRRSFHDVATSPPVMFESPSLCPLHRCSIWPLYSLPCSEQNVGMQFFYGAACSARCVGPRKLPSACSSTSVLCSTHAHS